MLEKSKPTRVSGTAVFLTSDSQVAPSALMHNLKHTKVLHERVFIVSVKTEETPRVSASSRYEIEQLSADFTRITLHYGFMESPEVMKDLCRAMDFKGLKQMDNISFYQSRELLLTTGKSKMAQWRKKLFVFLSRLARPATGYFQLPPRQVIELGIQMEM
jgi:KUP system potassium uptake protein